MASKDVGGRGRRRWYRLPKRLRERLGAIAEGPVVVGVAVVVDDPYLVARGLDALGFQIAADRAVTPDRFVPPAEFGPVATVNLNGEVVIRRDLPKETKYNEIESPNWGDWNQGSHTVYLPYQRYPREERPGRNLGITVEVVVQPLGGKTILKFAVDHRYEIGAGEEILFAANLLREAVGACDIYPASATWDDYMAGLVVDWEILPAGTREQHIERMLAGIRGQRDRVRAVLAERYDLLRELGATTFIRGTGGFLGYFAARFDNGCVVLDHFLEGNAAYAMDWTNFEQLSQLSRTELRRAHADQHVRVEHRGLWRERLSAVVIGWGGDGAAAVA